MSIKALQEYTRIAKYARYNPSKRRRETWDEQVERVFEMHENKFESVMDRLKPYFDEAKTAVKRKLVLGSQRALQFGGQAIINQNAKMYNCSYSHINRERVFQECMYLLLCGCGVGSSVQAQHIEKLSNISRRTKGVKTFVIPDSIEGWADAIGVIMNSYFENPVNEFKEYNGYKIEFDYSLIRPEGALIKSSGHKAPGPNGLINSINKIESLIEKLLDTGANRLRSIDAYDIIMHTSDAVLSGGVRRSACITLFSKDDELMLNAKTGNWFYENPQRGRSNNSVMLLRDSTTREEWAHIMKSVKSFGEPGFIWTDDLEIGFNPCVEIGLNCIDSRGNTGFSFCNLTEINGRKCKTELGFYDVCRSSAIIGTLQAAYTEMPYMFDSRIGYNVTEAVIKEEALLGCSITGIQDSPEILLNPQILRNGVDIIKKVNEEVAAIIGINTAARTTAVKPAGTTSLLLGTASGIHPHHSRRYFRRVQANINEETLKFFKLFNKSAVVKSVWSNNGTDDSISFLCEVPEGARVKNDHSALRLLEDVKLVQENWVTYGTRVERSRLKNITHNVSNTCNIIDEKEWDDVEEYIYLNRKWFAGISLLSMSGDLDYPQAPFQAVHTPLEIAKIYGNGSLMASGLIVDGLRVFDNNLWLACDAVNGYGISDAIQNDAQKDWIRRAKKFAVNYFDNDIKKMAYCLKEVHSWKDWCDLSREYTSVPWDEMFEDVSESKNASDDAATACAGGACELVRM